MKTKRLTAILLCLCLVFALFPIRALAAEGQKSYVALGDSITSGYGLSDDDPGFTELVAESGGYALTNLAEDGAATADLLETLSEEETSAAVAEADLITVTIGGNDLMGALYGYLAEKYNEENGTSITAEDVAELLAGGENAAVSQIDMLTFALEAIPAFPESAAAAGALSAFEQNLADILSAVEELNPDAALIVVNQYNPYGHLPTNVLIFDLSSVISAVDSAVRTLNAVIWNTADGCAVADAYTAFAEAEENPCNASFADLAEINLDFHPNAFGHELIAYEVYLLLPEEEGGSAEAAGVSVGGVTLTGSADSPAYARTDENGSVTTEGADETNYNIKWDGSTLTLKDAAIEMDSSDSGAIDLVSEDAAAALTIQLEGRNTLRARYGICLESYVAATLAIEGGGSLYAGGDFGGIQLDSLGAVSLSIVDADVIAAASGISGCGVHLSAGDETSASLTVDGGSLTADGVRGIWFTFGANEHDSGTASLTLGNSALVDARYGGIEVMGNGIVAGDVTPTGDGIVFDGDDGTVYGDVTLQEDVEIGAGESLALGSGASLNAGGHKVIMDGGTLDGSLAASLDESAIYYKAAGVSLSADNLTLEENGTATLTASITPDNATSQNVTWSSDPGDVVTVTPDENDSKTAVITATGTGTATIWAAVDDEFATCTVTVNPAQYTVTVQTEGSGTASASAATAAAGTTVTLTASPNGGYDFAGWEVVSGSITIENNAFTMPAENVTVRAVFARNSGGSSIYTPSRPSAGEPEEAAETGWAYEDGVWRYYEDGEAATGWLYAGGKWYYLDQSGVMQTGWELVNGTWYYLQSDGAMATGWQYINGTWYFLHDWGGMATGWLLRYDTTWYYLQSWGGMATGWLNLNGTWYYLYDWGGMAANTYVDGCYLSGSGAWIE